MIVETHAGIRTIKVLNMAGDCVANLQLEGQESLERVMALIKEDAAGLAQAPTKLTFADGSIIDSAQQISSLVDGDILIIVTQGIAEHAPVVVDVGSTMCRAGIVGENLLRGSFECSVIAPNHSSCIHSVLLDFDAMHKIWQHAFCNELGVDPMEHPVLMTVPPIISRGTSEKIVQEMFETFSVPNLILVTRNKLEFFQAHFSTGPFRDPVSFCQAMASDDYTSWNVGSVIHVGNKYTVAVPIYQGYDLPHAIQVAPRGGHNLFESFAKNAGMRIDTASDLAAVGGILMQSGSCDAHSYDMNRQQTSNEVRSQCIEHFLTDFFDDHGWKIPSTLSNVPATIGKFFTQAVRLCDEDIRVDVCRNIVLSGNVAQLPGLADGIVRKLEDALTADDTQPMWN